jgi:hypothetical protein
LNQCKVNSHCVEDKDCGSPGCICDRFAYKCLDIVSDAPDNRTLALHQCQVGTSCVDDTDCSGGAGCSCVQTSRSTAACQFTNSSVSANRSLNVKKRSIIQQISFNDSDQSYADNYDKNIGKINTDSTIFTDHPEIRSK